MTLGKSPPFSDLNFFVCRMGTCSPFPELIEKDQLGLDQQPTDWGVKSGRAPPRCPAALWVGQLHLFGHLILKLPAVDNGYLWGVD